MRNRKHRPVRETRRLSESKSMRKPLRRIKEYVDNPYNADEVVKYEVRDVNGNVIRDGFKDVTFAKAFARAQSATIKAPLTVYEVTTDINSNVGDYSYDTKIVTFGESVRKNRRMSIKESYAVDEWDYEDFLDNIRYDITADTTDDEIESLVRDAIDSAVTYTSDCWAIAIAFGATKFNEFDHLVGEVNNIETLAYAVLLREMYDYGGISKLVDYCDELIEDAEYEE